MGGRGWTGAGLSLAALAWFHRFAYSRLIGAGDLSQDARGERRRGEESGERDDGKVPRAGLNKETGHRPASLFGRSDHSAISVRTEKGAL